MPAGAAGQVPGVPFQQRNYENWSYANAQKDCNWEMCGCPLFLLCAAKKRKIDQDGISATASVSSGLNLNISLAVYLPDRIRRREKKKITS